MSTPADRFHACVTAERWGERISFEATAAARARLGEREQQLRIAALARVIAAIEAGHGARIVAGGAS